MADYIAAMEPKKKGSAWKGMLLATHKRCSMCHKMKPRTEFYKRPDTLTNDVSAKCKPCHVAYVNKREKEKKERRAVEREARNKELARRAREIEEGHR
jgi:hypothetical protein